MSVNNISDIGSIRELVTQYQHDEIEHCMESQVNVGCNVCLKIDDSDKAVNLLAKAGFMHTLINDGYSINDAIRELGRRMRVFN